MRVVTRQKAGQEASGSFLKKRTKKLSSVQVRVAATRTQSSKSFLALFSKKDCLIPPFKKPRGHFVGDCSQTSATATQEKDRKVAMFNTDAVADMNSNDWLRRMRWRPLRGDNTADQNRIGVGDSVHRVEKGDRSGDSRS
jgi:hypothetical protein